MRKWIIAILLALAASVAADVPIPINYPIATPYPELQNEEQIWACPTDSNVVIAVWRDFRLGYRQVGIGRSTDGGNTWTDSLISFSQQILMRQSDPTLSVDNNGNFYISVMDFQSIGTYDSSYISFHVSTDQGLSWNGPYTVEPGLGPYLDDKQFVTVDRTNGPYSGNLYLAWARYSGDTPVRIMFARSTDGAQTFDDTLVVGPAIHDLYAATVGVRPVSSPILRLEVMGPFTCSGKAGGLIPQPVDSMAT